MSITHQLVRRLGFDPAQQEANGYSWNDRELFYNKKKLYDERTETFGFNPENEGEVLALEKAARQLWGAKAELHKLDDPNASEKSQLTEDQSDPPKNSKDTLVRGVAGSVAGRIAGQAIGASTPIPGGAVIGGAIGSYVGKQIATSDKIDKIETLFAQKFGIGFKDAPEIGIAPLPAAMRELPGIKPEIKLEALEVGLKKKSRPETTLTPFASLKPSWAK